MSRSAATGETRLLANLQEMERTREAYWTRYPGTSPTKLRWRALTVKHAFHVMPGETVLELGAGSGLWTRHLSDVLRGECPVTAAVFNDDLEEQLAARGLPNVSHQLITDLAKDLPENGFDYVVGTAILCHDEYALNLKALFPLLKPGGQILFFESNFWNPQVLVKSLVPWAARRAGNAASQVGMRKYRLLQETSRQGFTNIEIIPYDIVHPRTPERAIPAVQSTAYLVERLPGLRELCGTLYIWAKKPGDRRRRRRHADLAFHENLFGSTSVVIPCRNEATTIGRLYEALTEAYDRYLHEIVFVDDASTDDTAAVVEELATRDPRVKLVRRSDPPGVGRALRDGLREATGRYILTLDSDFTLIVPELRDLFDAVAEGAEGALGSRFSYDSILVNYPLPKILANRAFHLLLRPLTGLHVRDVTNNLKLYPRELAQRIPVTEDGFAANAEIGLEPLLDGSSIVEVPISWIDRTPDMGRSSFGIVRAGPGYARVLRRAARRGRGRPGSGGDAGQ